MKYLKTFSCNMLSVNIAIYLKIGVYYFIAISVKFKLPDKYLVFH